MSIPGQVGPSNVVSGMEIFGLELTESEYVYHPGKAAGQAVQMEDPLDSR